MHLFTLDLEIYDKIKEDPSNFDEYIDKTSKVLTDIFKSLKEKRVRITCFVTSDFIENYSDIFHSYIVKIAEIGCHTHSHDYFGSFGKRDFLDSIRSNKRFIYRETGIDPIGFRAPGTLIPKDLPGFLVKMGFKYDSSILPGIVPGRIFKPFLRKKPYFPSLDNIFEISSNQKRLLEIPLATTSILRLSLNGLFFPYLFPINRKAVVRRNMVTYTHVNDYIENIGKSYPWDVLNLHEKNRRLFNEIMKYSENKDLSLSKYRKKFLMGFSDEYFRDYNI